MLDINSTLGMRFPVTSRHVSRISDRSICVVYLKPMRRPIPARKSHDRHARETASSRAYQAIRELILRGGLAPGAPINERALMEQIGIGRTPIREALLRLSAEALVIFSGQSIY